MKLRRCGCVCCCVVSSPTSQIIHRYVCVCVSQRRKKKLRRVERLMCGGELPALGRIDPVCMYKSTPPSSYEKMGKKKNEMIQQSVRSIISLTARSSCCHHRSVYSAYSICPAVPFQSKKKTQNRKAKNKSNPWNRIVSFMQRLKKRGGGFRIQDR